MGVVSDIRTYDWGSVTYGFFISFLPARLWEFGGMLVDIDMVGI